MGKARSAPRAGGAGLDPSAEIREDKKNVSRGRLDRRADDAASEGALAIPIGLGLFCVMLAVYTATAYPSVPGGDAGELVFTSCSLGVAHPPGLCPPSR